MALLGKAALAMWWDMAPAMKSEFEDWHTHEHFPERLSVPGFLRSSRWTDAHGGPGVFVIYELDSHGVLSSPAYLARLNDPTPWSRKLMPYHDGMVRSQSHTLITRGDITGRYAVTLRLDLQNPEALADLRDGLQDTLIRLPEHAGIIGAHLLAHETPAIARTTEQVIRGTPDRTADVVVVLVGYEQAPLHAALARDLSEATLRSLGALGSVQTGTYSLSHSALSESALPPG
ncbi:hypothetical protein [Bordetella sp. N]|uniref:hypothetical protein n=1 Tax=Bordetella sp. N TaxID=1746199 RepID=UPI00070AFABD|nr:hypothetical protein [Bordetella sp. N]ALM84151.1 hypothetical protein ASB57_15260 [Bordetella sp. N]